MKVVLLFSALVLYGSSSWTGGEATLRDVRLRRSHSASSGWADLRPSMVPAGLRIRLHEGAHIRLRGGCQDELPEPDVNHVREKRTLSAEELEELRDAEGEAAMAAAQAALGEGRFDEARRLHQVHIVCLRGAKMFGCAGL
jgi:hypothetical protein